VYDARLVSLMHHNICSIQTSNNHKLYVTLLHLKNQTTMNNLSIGT